MGYTDNEKLGFCKSTIIAYVRNISTWTDFKNFVNAITSAKLKTKLKKAYQDSIAENDDSIIKHQVKKGKSQLMDSEIDNF